MDGEKVIERHRKGHEKGELKKVKRAGKYRRKLC